MNRPNFLSGVELDRAAELRAKRERIEEMWRDIATRVVPLWRSQHVVLGDDPPEIVFVSPRRLEGLRGLHEARVLLGTVSDVAYFAVDVSELEAPFEALGLDDVHRLAGLREIAALVSREGGALLAYANAVMSWHRRHRFCGRCGSATAVEQAGHARVCKNESCGETHFPRTDPAVIMLVADGARCLLGRQASWPEGVYSTLAGFVEPGESLEEAVAREIREETGIEVDDVRYHSSQPWPFPSSIMLGFEARAKTREIRLKLDELEDARWFRREELREGGGVRLPTKISIARRLIEDWLASASE